MKDQFIKTLLESGAVTSDTAQAITEAWESKLHEARSQISEGLRQEFAQKYEHDKNVMVTALDKMLSESLAHEIKEFTDDKRAMLSEQVKVRAEFQNRMDKLDHFIAESLGNEIVDLRKDREKMLSMGDKLEQFVVESIAQEIKEFKRDKDAAIAAKVKLVAEGRKQITALKKKFIKENAIKLKKAVQGQLTKEITQLKEDIEVAQRRDFGQKIFEAFAAEFSATHLNERAETKKLMKQIAEKERELTESKKKIAQTKKLVEAKEREVKVIKESTQRERLMGELLGTLNKEKSRVMKDLLESVQTSKLKDAFDKYLPAVISAAPETTKQKVVLSESTIVTGDKSASKTVIEDDTINNIIDFKRLAGL
jgi:hypothetical protein